MKAFPSSCLIVAVCFVLASASTSQAKGPYVGGCYLGDYYGYGIYRGANRQVLPYFALHPPVYYSHVVPRPYGYSPFALPPGVPPAEVVQERVKPKEIENPYFRPEKENTTLDKTAAIPRVIENPFYENASDKASVENLVGN